MSLTAPQISLLIPQAEKCVKCDRQRAVVLQPNLKYFHESFLGNTGAFLVVQEKAERFLRSIWVEYCLIIQPNLDYPDSWGLG